MKQLELFGELKPIQKWLHVWTDAERERNKKTADRLPRKIDGCKDGCENKHQAASFSEGSDESSGHTSIQLVRKC